jgi:myb proto-oncogene protein
MEQEEPTVTPVHDGSGDEALLALGEGDVSNGNKVKGPWSPEEDAVLSRLVSQFGARNWSLIARGIAGRSGKSCRLRWCNQLDPAVKRKPFTGTLLLAVDPFFNFSFNLILCFVFQFF